SLDKFARVVTYSRITFVPHHAQVSKSWLVAATTVPASGFHERANKKMMGIATRNCGLNSNVPRAIPASNARSSRNEKYAAVKHAKMSAEICPRIAKWKNAG